MKEGRGESGRSRSSGEDGSGEVPYSIPTPLKLLEPPRGGGDRAYACNHGTRTLYFHDHVRSKSDQSRSLRLTINFFFFFFFFSSLHPDKSANPFARRSCSESK